MADPEIRFSVQIEETMAFAADQEPAGLEIRVNFGMFGGRDATSAELDELGKLLVPEVGDVSIVAEQRHEMSSDAEAQQAIQQLNGQDLKGRALKVNEAIDKGNNRGGGGGFGGGGGGRGRRYS